MTRQASRVEVANVSISHPDRVLYPEPAITKLDLATIERRLARLRRDPWKDYWTSAQRLSSAAIAAVRDYRG